MKTLEYRLEECHRRIGGFEVKYGMPFGSFARAWDKDRIAGKHSAEVESGCFSFFPSKNPGAFGDGGLIATNDDEIAETARMLRVHGSRKKCYKEAIGYNSRLDELQAAILRVRLPHIDEWNEGRRQAAYRYNEL